MKDKKSKKFKVRVYSEKGEEILSIVISGNEDKVYSAKFIEELIKIFK